MIKVEKLNKSFNSLQVIKNLSLHIKKGEVISIVGPSGCGKSTLLRCITGLDNDFTGKVIIDKINSKDYFKNKRIAVVLQKYSNFPWLTVSENIQTAFIDDSKITQKQIDINITKLLRNVHLENFGESYIQELSGGMQQRVAVARALAQNTEILAFDEPFGALDITTRNKLQLLFKELNERLHKTVIFVTHDIEEAIFVSDRIIVLSKTPTYIFKEFESVHKHNHDDSIKYSKEFIKLKQDIESTLQEANNI